ncbi:translation elongation factor-like protein [Candidatus Pacearchaeota archaeon]|nr:translation elongation factor-like protein [Candidatus Pacearchaeota archaeon]
MAEKEIGVITNFFEHVNAAAIKLSGALKIGDKIKIKGGETEFEQVVDSMQINRVPVKAAKKGDEIGVLVKEKVRKEYKVFKV